MQDLELHLPNHLSNFVIPAKAGTQEKQGALQFWVPAFAGMTHWGKTVGQSLSCSIYGEGTMSEFPRTVLNCVGRDDDFPMGGSPGTSCPGRWIART